ERRVEVLSDQRADVRTVRVEEGDRDPPPAEVRQPNRPAAVVVEREPRRERVTGDPDSAGVRRRCVGVRGCRRVAPAAACEHNQREREQRERAQHASAHCTLSVNGAVTMWPFTWHCRNNRHVPATGTSTPTVSFPGVDDVPVTRAPPSRLVHPVAPGAHTWVWK